MRVKCVKLLDALGQPASRSAWVSVGAVYDVLTLTVEPSGAIRVRIISNDGTPGLHPLSQFEIVDNNIPGSWRIFCGHDGNLVMGPASWARAGFWERYFDNEAVARKDFGVELERLKHNG